MNSAATKQVTDTAPSPWDSGLKLEGSLYAPVPMGPHEQAVSAADERRMELLGRLEARRARSSALHEYEDRLRVAELQVLSTRLERLERRRADDRPLFRDAAVGFVATASPALVAVNGLGREHKARGGLAALSVLLGLVAGQQWAEHQHERRVQRVEDELDRLEGKLATRSIPRPALMSDSDDLLDHLMRGMGR